MTYLKTILMRDDGELTKRIYKEQICQPTVGDFSELIRQDFDSTGLIYDGDQIISSSHHLYKQTVKRHIRAAALKFLMKQQANHSKINQIK